MCGVGGRITESAVDHLGRLFGREVTKVRVTDPRFFHLDVSFCPLDERCAICAPDVWDEQSVRAVEAIVPDVIAISRQEALTFCANSVVVGRTVVMPACPPRVKRQLNRRALDVYVTAVDEFLKAGGGVRCMALDLDLFTPLHVPPSPTPASSR